jgi:hypothetical protein
LARYLQTGNRNKKQIGGYKKKILGENTIIMIKDLIRENCSVTLKTIKEKLLSELGINVSIATICRCIEDFNYSFKRVTPVVAVKNDPVTIEMRYRYAQEFISFIERNDGENVFFVDEVGFNASMRSKGGRSLKGDRANQIVQKLRTRNISVCCAMSKMGTVHYKQQNFPFNAITFKEYLVELFEKFAQKGINEAILVMDNVRFYKVAEIKRMVEEAGHEIKLLPRYSPCLNPIENLFSQWKQLVRAERVQNVVELISVINNVFLRITNENCLAYYRNMFKYILKSIAREPIND